MYVCMYYMIVFVTLAFMVYAFVILISNKPLVIRITERI